MQALYISFVLKIVKKSDIPPFSPTPHNFYKKSHIRGEGILLNFEDLIPYQIRGIPNLLNIMTFYWTPGINSFMTEVPPV